MKTKHVIALIIGSLCLVWFIWALLNWGSSPKYDPAVTTATVKRVLTNRGVEVCGENILAPYDAPGLVSARSVSVSTNCDIDKDPVKLTLLEFEDEAARNAAQQRVASTHRGGFGPHFAYSYGPFVITMQGTRGIGDQLLVGKILSEAAQ